MKKHLIVTLALFVLGSVGVALAQAKTSAAQHEVSVTLPEVVTIRFTAGSSRAAVTDFVDLTFQPTADQASAGGSFPATNLATRGWDDVQVFQNRASTWNVAVTLTNPSTGFDWSKVVVTPRAGAIASAFDLKTLGTIAESTAATARGWNRLGFGPANFALVLDGTETAGAYSATVVYTLTAP